MICICACDVRHCRQRKTRTFSVVDDAWHCFAGVAYAQGRDKKGGGFGILSRGATLIVVLIFASHHVCHLRAWRSGGTKARRGREVPGRLELTTVLASHEDAGSSRLAFLQK